MYTHPAHPAPRPSILVRSGVTASAAALVLAGFSAPAEAHIPEEVAAPPVTDGNGAEVADNESADDVTETENEAVDADEPNLYEVVPGDYLASIAAENGLDPIEGWRMLFDANPEVEHPDVIHPGQELRIPEPDEELEPRALPAPPPPVEASPAPAEVAPETAPVPEQSAVESSPAPEQSTAEASPAPQQSTPEPAPAPATAPEVNTSAPAGVWDRLAQCEAGGNWHINTGNGYYGGLQFTQSSWQAVGGSGLPHEASRGEQIQRGQQLQAIQGWGAWPSCSRQLGLR